MPTIESSVGLFTGTMWMSNRLLAMFMTFLAGAVASGQIPTVRVGDVTHLQGQGTNVLVAMGLVTGLNGTGDGGKYRPAMEQLRTLLAGFGTDVQSLDELIAAKNVAVVSVEVTVPEHGAREGERLDVYVTAHGAKSLAGGRLLPTPLVYHDKTVQGLYGFASGTITTTEEHPTAGRIVSGARMEHDVLINVLARGGELANAGFRHPWIEPGSSYLTLVLDDAHAGWSMAAAVAQAVDKELSLSADVDRVALALDSKNVVVLVPQHQLGDPASWIRDVERTPILMESNEARITVNRQTGTIVVTGDTRLSPIIVSQRGMTVTVSTVDGTTAQPEFERNDFVPLDVEAQRLPNVRDLLEALNRLKVPFEDRVAILEEIHRAGKLHARMLFEG